VPDDCDSPTTAVVRANELANHTSVEGGKAAGVYPDPTSDRAISDTPQEQREQRQRTVASEKTRQQKYAPAVATRHVTPTHHRVGYQTGEFAVPTQFEQRMSELGCLPGRNDRRRFRL
jgi:hypothetical protein